jgi:endogenous inhibitor of DNA gyrase (YacG/DUF329 family)
MPEGDKNTILEFTRFQKRFHGEYSETKRALEKKAEEVNLMGLKCVRHVELKLECETLLPPTAINLSRVSSEILILEELLSHTHTSDSERLSKRIHSLTAARIKKQKLTKDLERHEFLGPTTQSQILHCELKELTDWLKTEEAITLQHELMATLETINEPLSSLRKHRFCSDGPVATIALYPGILTGEFRVKIIEHQANLARFNREYARINLLMAAKNLAQLSVNSNSSNQKFAQDLSTAEATLAQHIRNALPENAECPICSEDNFRPFCTTKCSHTFHRHCLAPWLPINSSCPYCRAAVVEMDLR